MLKNLEFLKLCWCNLNSTIINEIVNLFSVEKNFVGLK